MSIVFSHQYHWKQAFQKKSHVSGIHWGSYLCPPRWRLFFQKRPGFLSVFSQGRSRGHPACCLCRAWWGFRWVWTCLSRHCILLWKVEEGQRVRSSLPGSHIWGPGKKDHLRMICVNPSDLTWPSTCLGLVFSFYHLLSLLVNTSA